jgi:polysaccharide export outer membrane protein
MYVLGPGDSVLVEVFGATEFSGAQVVLIDGTISLPLAGILKVEGLTLQQTTDEITFRLSAFLERPIVSVRLQQPRPLKIAVVGEVNRPGAYTAPSVPTPPTVTQLLQAAQGITESADVRRIQVRRSQGTGQFQTVMVDLWSFLQGGDLSRDLTLRDADSIFVPTASVVAPEDAEQLAAANFSTVEPITVNLIGEVRRPGRQEVPPNSTLSQAIFAAGGFSPRAETFSVELLRLNPNGSVTIREVELDLRTGINEKTNPVLLDGDIVTIRPTALAQVSDNIGVITDPILRIQSFINLFDGLFGSDDNRN